MGCGADGVLRRVVHRGGADALAAILMLTVSPSAFASGRADVVVTAISDPPLARFVNEGFNVNMTIKNKSRTRKAPASTFTLYLSSDATKDAGDAVLGSTPVPALR